MVERSKSGWLVADFFVHSYRISGRLDVRHKRLADQLNDHTTSFLQLEAVYISNIEQPAHITTSYPDSILRKDNIIAVIVAEQGDELPREQTYGSYLGTYLQKAFVTVPYFEIEGDLRLSSRADLRSVLVSGTSDFVQILDGQMRTSAHPDIVFGGGAILVNKKYIGSFWAEEG